MELFCKLEEACAVVTTASGIFKQVDLYSYEGRLFFKSGAGFIGLNKDKTTTNQKTRWREIIGVNPKVGKFGQHLEI